MTVTQLSSNANVSAASDRSEQRHHRPEAVDVAKG
jgi:hypothetical protein